MYNIYGDINNFESNIWKIDNAYFKLDYGAKWLLIAHHNSTNNEYYPETNLTYNENYNTYSIISTYKDVSHYLKRVSQNFYLLEYPELHSYQIWKQDSELDEINVTNYEFQKGDRFSSFKGISYCTPGCAYLDGISSDYGWSYAISSMSRCLSEHPKSFPGPIITLVQYVQHSYFWIKLENIYKDSCVCKNVIFHEFLKYLVPFITI